MLKKILHSFRSVARDTGGYTLIELAVSIMITVIIIVGASFFVYQVNSEIVDTKNRTQIHVEMSNFTEKINLIRTTFSTGVIFQGITPGYSTLFFTNTGVTAGALVGVVDLNLPDTNGAYYLDHTGSYTTYGKKVIAITELNAVQAQTLRTSTGSAYLIPFRLNKIYPALHAVDFQAVYYNSGAIIELDTNIREKFVESYVWRPVNNVNSKDTYPYHLVF